MDRRRALPPIGLRLSRVAHVVTEAFERAMADAGGSASSWQVLLLVRSEQWDTQSRMAQAMGITGATLTHHLNALERQGLVRRWREDSNRRVQRAALTDDGEALFQRLRHVALRHDERLRSGLTDAEIEVLAKWVFHLSAVAHDRLGENWCRHGRSSGSPARLGGRIRLSGGGGRWLRPEPGTETSER